MEPLALTQARATHHSRTEWDRIAKLVAQLMDQPIERVCGELAAAVTAAKRIRDVPPRTVHMRLLEQVCDRARAKTLQEIITPWMQAGPRPSGKERWDYHRARGRACTVLASSASHAASVAKGCGVRLPLLAGG